MRTAIARAVSILLAAAFILSSILTGTLSWQSLSQNADNELREHQETLVDVRLVKLEKLPDGTKTATPVPGAAFTLFTEDGMQIGGRYVTDANGEIAGQLPAGSYYFEELSPCPGFTFETDENGQRITRYPFAVTGEETEPVSVTAYNVRLQGALSVQKFVQTADESPLTEAQKQQTFLFTVTFSDGGTYAYRIDGGEEQQLASGGSLTLQHGQTAVFEQLPVGIVYNVTEQPEPGYTTTGTGHRGSITEDGCTAVFTNTAIPDQDETGSLVITKEVTDNSDGQRADPDKEFSFTVTFSDNGTYVYRIDGGDEQQLASGGTLTLKHGQTAIFENLPEGVQYTVSEADYAGEGYRAQVGEYTGQITGSEAVWVPFVNVYEPAAEPGGLTVEKEVVGENSDPDREFTFTVTFADGGTYEYRIDGGEAQQLASGGELRLKAGQQAVFEGLPDGMGYAVRESDAKGYLPMHSEAKGSIAGGETVTVCFQNRVPEEPDEPGEPAIIRVTKMLAGEYPEADRDREYRLTLLVEGQETAFTLRPGETKEFEVPAGAYWEVREDDYYTEGYSQAVTDGTGTALPGETVEVMVTNTFEEDWVQVEIEGEKTWELLGYEESVLPESITVRLLGGGQLVEEATVTPDSSGEWQYRFTGPKYDAEGEEIDYTVEEGPLYNFIPAYEGYNIRNTYVPPVTIDPPVIQKKVEGENSPETAFSFLLKGEEGEPMPEGSEGSAKIVTRSGSGETELGRITFEKAGVYSYRISELDGGEEGWSYDGALYTLTVTVTEQGGKLEASYKLEKEGQAAEKLEFVNRYESDEPDDTVVIQGTKTWEHGDNPEDKRPDSIIVEVYADGGLAVQKQVTAKEGWGYAFELPKYGADGHEIVYTVDEAEVPDYDKAIRGYDLVNTYRPSTPEAPDESDKPDDSEPGSGDSHADSSVALDGPDNPDTPDDSIPNDTSDPPVDPDRPDTPEPPATGDTSHIGLYFALLILCLTALTVSRLLRKKKQK